MYDKKILKGIFSTGQPLEIFIEENFVQRVFDKQYIFCGKKANREYTLKRSCLKTKPLRGLPQNEYSPKNFWEHLHGLLWKKGLYHDFYRTKVSLIKIFARSSIEVRPIEKTPTNYFLLKKMYKFFYRKQTFKGF